MKNVCVGIAIVAASVLFSNTAISEETTKGLPDSYDQYKSYEFNSQKDQCLVVAKNCFVRDSVLKRVERLNREIEKGATVYTPEELKGFMDQLNWIYYESGEFPAVRM